jgi:predicted nucleic acid-binding protein
VPIVVDTSVVIAVAANEPVKARLIELTHGEELTAAAPLPWEVGNALSAMFKQRRITLDQGMELLRQYRRIPIRLLDVDLESSIQLAAEFNVYAYDAYVIQCARHTGQRVLTLDGGLKDAARRAQVAVMEV